MGYCKKCNSYDYDEVKNNFRWLLEYFLAAGVVLSTVISWYVNHSALWALVHGVFSWIYVIYYYNFIV